eukprot:2420546-Prymnesium_polylepis.1
MPDRSSLCRWPGNYAFEPTVSGFYVRIIGLGLLNHACVCGLWVSSASAPTRRETEPAGKVSLNWRRRPRGVMPGQLHWLLRLGAPTGYDDECE